MLHVITRLFLRGSKSQIRQDDDGSRGRYGAKECGWPLEAGKKNMEMDSILESPEGTSPANTLM